MLLFLLLIVFCGISCKKTPKGGIAYPQVNHFNYIDSTYLLSKATVTYQPSKENIYRLVLQLGSENIDTCYPYTSGLGDALIMHLKSRDSLMAMGTYTYKGQDPGMLIDSTLCYINYFFGPNRGYKNQINSGWMKIYGDTTQYTISFEFGTSKGYIRGDYVGKVKYYIVHR
jgi:hypothetical protein